MAQPQINKTKWSPQQGGLVSDIDPKDLSGGNLLVNGVETGGMNIRNVGKGQNVMMDYEPIYGNEYVYTPDPVVVQNKKWRIYVDCSQAPVLVNQPDVVLNGDFNTDLSNWSTNVPGSWVWNNAGQYAQHIPGPGNASILQQTQFNLVPGVYDVTFTIVNRTAGYVFVQGTTDYDFSNIQYNANGTYTVQYVVPVNASNGYFDLKIISDDNFDGGIDAVSARKSGEVYYFNLIFTTSSGYDMGYVQNSLRYFPILNNIGSTLTAIEDWFLWSSGNFGPPISTFLPSTSQVITGAYTGYVELEFASSPNFDYIFDEIYQSISNIPDCVNVVVSQEAIDPGCVGEWNLIGSDDKPTDSFQFWTTRRTLPVDLEIFNITNPSGTTVRVETVNPHGLVNNQAVRISQVSSLPEVNGIWTVTYVNATAFNLNNCIWVGPSFISGGIVTINIYGLGEIGVAVEDDQGVISYTRLLRSKEFNFTTLWQIDCRAKRKQDIQKFAVYYTDNFNVPRVFYYKGAYQTDGALNFISSENIYAYGSIAAESRWILNGEDFYIEVVGQDQGGGSLKSGTWRYSARLLTSDFTATQWSQITEGIPVFKDSIFDPAMIGSIPDSVTPKVNNLKLTNNVPGLYSYVEIAALYYFNDIAPQGFIIGRYVLENSNEQFISHTGFEQNLLDLDVGSLNIFVSSFIKAQNVELLDNRAILSNLTPAQTYDFTEWVKTFQYKLNADTIPSVGSWSGNTLTTSEYMVPMNVYNYKSHMMMETYRYGFMFKLKNGSLTQVFYPGYDIKIDLPTLPDPTRPERLAGTFVSYDLTDISSSYIYTISISWENINLAFDIDGVPAFDLISEIIPCRATVIPEVLLHGAIGLGVSGNFEMGLAYRYTTFGNVSPYPFIAGNSAEPAGINLPPYPGTSSGGASFTAERRSFFFYAPDHYFDLYDVTYQAGDQLYVLGNPNINFTATITGGKDSYYGEYNGYTSQTSTPTPYSIAGTAESDYPLESQPQLPPTVYLISGANHNAGILLQRFVPPWQNFYIWYNEKCLIGRTTSDISNTGPFTDNGFYRAIYYRSLPNKYGDPLSTKYTEALKPYRIGLNSGYISSGSFLTYGDCFTQKSYLKLRYPGSWEGTNPGNWAGWGMGIGLYTQNRNNIQLRCPIDENYNTTFSVPRVPYQVWAGLGHAQPGSLGYNAEGQWQYLLPSGLGRDAQLFYNKGYTPINNVVTNSAFNELLEYQTDWGNAIAWSAPESEGSNTDNLRVFPPLNLKFLDYTQGSITDARAINGELYTIQPREVQRQYFNTTALLNTQNGGEAYLGSGAVLSRRGNTMNKFGSRHKWSIIMGLSDKGGDVLYGIDDINNTVWRLGYDGTNSLDEIQGMKSFFANNLEWIRGKYKPAHDEGIRGVANQRYREVIWTLRGRKQYTEFTTSGNFCQLFSFDNNVGNEIIFNGNFVTSASFSGWDSLDNLYAPNTTWSVQYETSIGQYVAEKSAADEGFLTQTTPLPLIAGTTYIVEIQVPISPTIPLQVSFQQSGPVAYTITSAGNYSFAYTAVSGDDNIYIYSPIGSDAFVGYISIKESFQTGANWNGGGDWIFSNNMACTDGPVVTPLVQLASNYTIPNTIYLLTFSVQNYVSGDLVCNIGTATSSPIGIVGDGVYIFPIPASTTSGVIALIPVGTFEGCIKGNIKICTSGVLKIYNTGDIVQTSGYGGVMSTWSQTPDLWICLKDNVTSNPYSPPDPDDPDWELIPHTNPAYYTEYTIVYNELKNKFQTFMTILPRIYAHFQSGYLVPKPISDTGRMYVSDTGIPTTWFDTQTGDAYIEAVINQPAGRKRFLAARVESDVAPTSMTVTSSSGSSSILAAEFEQREGQEFDGYVKDTTTESIIMGDFGIFRFTIAAGTYNKINSFIASVRERARKWFR